ncbi:MAG: serine hydrolase [Candidatus Pacebacteria bacterium]|nr:serine hydrolase [Candidatus Paceibacterota bacterium]
MKVTDKGQFKKSIKFVFVFSLLFLGFTFFTFKAQASQESLINLDQNTVNRGYTVSSLDNKLKLSLTPNILSEASLVKTEIIDESFAPFSLEQLSPVYQFEFLNKSAYDHDRPFYIQLAYDKENSDYKQVFFFDKNYGSWRPLPTQDFPEENFVRSLIHLPYARLAVFSYPSVLGQGEASWYAYKGGMFAASPDFPKGSKVRVYNLANNKYVDVEINDFGPDRSIFPNRAIDLDKEAFKKISALSAGLIEVSLEPLHVPKDNTGRILGLSSDGALLIPEIKAKSAIVIDQDSGEVLWEKDAETILPIASLTKLIAVKVFLNNNRNLEQVVEYKYQDEEYNYQYCSKWESARLRVSEGETMTIKDLLYATLVSSANNAVETLVRYSGISRDKFIKQMNSLADDLEAKDTHFKEPTGLSTENVSSALDYAIITKKALEDPIIKEIAGTRSYSFSTINTNKKHNLYSTNYWLRYDIMPFSASKTGYLHEAGNCLFVSIPYGDKNLIAVILGATSKEESLFASKDMFNFAQSKF